jgi:hypothetical protein
LPSLISFAIAGYFSRARMIPCPVSVYDPLALLLETVQEDGVLEPRCRRRGRYRPRRLRPLPDAGAAEALEHLAASLIAVLGEVKA